MEVIDRISSEKTPETQPPREDAEDAISDNGVESSMDLEEELERELEMNLYSDFEDEEEEEEEGEDEEGYDDPDWFRAAEKRWTGGSERYTEEDRDNSEEDSPATSTDRKVTFGTEVNAIQSGFLRMPTSELQGDFSRHQFRGVRIQKDESQVQFHTAKFPETEITSFLASTEHESSQWALNIVIIPEKAALPISPYTKHQLKTYWAMHETCFDAHERLWSGVLTYTPVEGDDSWKGYLIRSDNSWSWACTLAISHNARSKTTYGVCMGLERREAESLIRLLAQEKRYAENPLFVPVALAELYIQTTVAMNRRHNKDFYNIQTAMKTDYYIASPKVPRTLDLVEFASRLTALGSSSVGVTQLCSTQHRIMQFLDDQLMALRQKPGADTVLTALHDRLAFARELLQAERQHNEYIKAAAQTQVQMVYSLTAQRDNEHSLNLARLSQKQNSINIQISKFAAYESRLSNKMAKQSLKYGVDMQIIAAVTLCFLPGTFMATLFSASFWDFQPDNKGRIVSSWVWLYWVLTIVLTLSVLAAWKIVSRVKADGIEPPPEPFVLENVVDSGETEV